MSNPLVCPKCERAYDEQASAPYLLVPCGCTICFHCLTQLKEATQEGAILCPLDGQESLNSCVNQALLRQVQDSCPEHPGQCLRYFCPQDDSPMCQDCLVFIHHGHERPLSLDEGLTRMRSRAKAIMEPLVNQKTALEELLKEVTRVRKETSQKKANVEESIRTSTEEAIQAVVQVRDSLLRELESATSEKEALLNTQVEELMATLQTIEVAKADLETRLTSRRATEITKAVEAASQVLDHSSKAALQPVVEVDLEYVDANISERREMLAYLVGESQAAGAGGLWGHFSKRAASTRKVGVSPVKEASSMRPQSSTVSQQSLVTVVGSVGQGDGNFQYPYHVACDDHLLYVSDFGNGRIVVLDKGTMAQVQVIDGVSGTSKRLKHPSGVGVDDKCIYVAESNSHAVRAMDKKTGAQVWRVGTGKSGASQSQFHSPRQVLADKDFVYVADYSNRRVVVLNKETGAHVGVLGASGDLGTPEGMALDPEEPNHLYVSDYERHRVQVIDKTTGARVRAFGTVGWSGDGNYHFNNPLGLAVAGANLYVADRGNHRVQVLNKKTGAHVLTLGETGKPGSAETLLDKPNGLATDGQRLYISEWGNHRLKAVKI